MQLTYKDLISSSLVNNNNKVLRNDNTEELTYFIHDLKGIQNIDVHTENLGITSKIQTFTVKNSQEMKDFIVSTYNKIDEIIDLDFSEKSNNDGSDIDIYSITYSSSFTENTVGQALFQTSEYGSWWDIFWKDNDSSKHTLIHEIGHTLGLSHPKDDPFNIAWTTDDTVMSYNIGKDGWNNWFTEKDLNALKNIWGRENDNKIINFDYNFSNYSFKREADKSLKVRTPYGEENITLMQSLSFSDLTVDVEIDIKGIFDQLTGVDEITGKIFRLYQSAFNRFPDRNGFNYWVRNNNNQIDTYKKSAASFIIAEEFENIYGSKLQDIDYVTEVYSNALGRLPDNDGLSYWLNQLSKGIDSRVDIIINFAESSESKDLFQAQAGLL